MRNIISCDLTASNFKMGVANAQCNKSCLYVNFIVSENVRSASYNEGVTVKLILQDSSVQTTKFTKLETNEIELEIPFETYKTAGNITVNLYTSTYTSGNILISIPTTIENEVDVLAKKDTSSNNKVILKISDFKNSVESMGSVVIDDIKCKNLFPCWIIGKGLSSSNGAINNNANGAVSSDYIPVDFSKYSNYYLSGLLSDYRTFVAAYNSNKEFLGRTGANKVNYISLSNTSFTNGTAQGTGEIAYLLVTTYATTDSTSEVSQVSKLETQLEIGDKASEYTPRKEYHGSTVVWAGICQGGNKISLDVSKYSKLKLYCMGYYCSYSFDVDLCTITKKTLESGYPYVVSGVGGCINNTNDNRFEMQYCECLVNDAKTEVYIRNIGYCYIPVTAGNSSNQVRNSNEYYYVYKIEAE